MNSGSLNKRITLQYQTKAPNGQGGFTVTWVDAATVWAAIWPKSAKERLETGQPTMTTTHRLRIRYRKNIKASWRAKFGNRYFNIEGIVNPNEAREWLDLLCCEVSA